MKTPLRYLLLAPFLLFAGCCANTACDCDDLFADAFYFQFNPASFAPADVDTVYLLRYSIANVSLAPDSVAIIRGQRRGSVLIRQLTSVHLDTTSTLVLSNNTPFSPGVTGGKINQYYYALKLYAGNRKHDTLGVYRYNIGVPRLTGRYNADGCCTCYQNTGKTLTVNNIVYVRTDTASTRPIVLSKYK